MAGATIIRVKINNLDKLRGRLDRYPAISGKYVVRAINESIGAIEAKAKPITPVKTGALLRSYNSGRVLATISSLKGKISPTVPYAIFVHNMYSPGTRYKKPSLNKKAVAGFLQVAVDKTENKINSIFNKALRDITKELAG